RGFLLTAAEFCGLDALGELTTTQPVCAAFRSAEVGSLCNHIRDDASVGQSPSLRLCAHAGRKALRMTKLDRLIHAMDRIEAAERAADRAWKAMCELEADDLLVLPEKRFTQRSRVKKFYSEVYRDLIYEQDLLLQQQQPSKPTASESATAAA